MENNDYSWALKADDKILGMLTTYGWYDFPWIGCNFEPTNEFAAYRHLFDNSLKLLEMDEIEKLDNLTEEINQLIKLIPLNEWTQFVSEYSLYIEGKDTRLHAIFRDGSKG